MLFKFPIRKSENRTNERHYISLARSVWHFSCLLDALFSGMNIHRKQYLQFFLPFLIVRRTKDPNTTNEGSKSGVVSE